MWRLLGPAQEIFGHIGKSFGLSKRSSGDDLGASGVIRGRPGVQGGLRKGNMLQTLCFNVFLRHTKKP